MYTHITAKHNVMTELGEIVACCRKSYSSADVAYCAPFLRNVSHDKLGKSLEIGSSVFEN